VTATATPCGSRNDIVLTQWLTVTGNRVYATFRNTSTTCSNLVGIATYKRFNNNIEDQELFDFQEYLLAPGETHQLSAALPNCSYQADAFWGPVIHSFRGGVRYGSRLIDDILSGGGWCRAATQTPGPTRTRTACDLCEANVTAVAITCNSDGTVHWSAQVSSDAACSVAAHWKVELQFTAGNLEGSFRTAELRTGTIQIQPGDSTLEGNICHAFEAGTGDIRVAFMLTSDDASCTPEGRSPGIPVCNNALNCGSGAAPRK
jgi:hypothetical protein